MKNASMNSPAAVNQPLTPNTQHPTPSSTLYGGQAVIEGVMMRGPRHFAVACRRANGEIALTSELVPKSLRPPWQKWPLLRGGFSLVDAMALGTKALFWAARVAEQDIVDPKTGKTPQISGEVQSELRATRTLEETVGPAMGTAVAARDPLPAGKASGSSRVTDVAIGSAMVLGLLIGLGLIVGIPYLITEAGRSLNIKGPWALALLDGSARLAIFFSYISLVGRTKNVRRVFQYHGAEHKAINALEAGDGMTVENARRQSRLHPRCGTSFVVIVMVVATVAFAFLRESPLYDALQPHLPDGLRALEKVLAGLLRIALMLGLMIPVAGVSFELLRLAGKYRGNPVAAALSRPGMWTQLLTTREPDDSQLEVALASLRTVMDAEQAEGRAPTTTVDRAASSVA